MSTSPAEKAAQLTALVKQVFGTSFVGFTIATTLYGITCLQAYLYFRNYPKDHLLLKGTVALLWVLDTLTTAFVAHSLYTFFVLNFGKPTQINLIIPWSFTAEKLLVTLITFVAQAYVSTEHRGSMKIFTNELYSFYARTIWRVSSNKLIPSIILLLALAALGAITNPLATAISERKFSILSGLVQGLASLDDILITAALCFFLHTRRAGFRSSTEQIIDSLMLYAVSRGILTAVTQIMFLVLNVALPHDTYWQPFHQAVGKLYVNSVFATLNVRSTFAEPTEVKLGNLQFMSGATSTQTHETSQNASQPNNVKVELPTRDASTASAYTGSFNTAAQLSMEMKEVKNPEA
ncbi:hypothetical protein D9615_000096 [Tricholomella constricta]|uniref:DUF6534 domain-containing protein n=1 Tax=Tricholomella constricta TaxID=117010 RepID=A0A8H5HR58_9AGAR|nr:hypothetical protein D9615_000096 [Tricholomella constricta]